jgi:hypothetical protein
MSSGLRIVGLAAAIAIVAFPCVGVAQVPQSVLGTWKMNVAKSTYSPGPAPRSTTSHWEVVPGGGAKGVVETVDAAGRSFHYELVTMFDGKEAEYKGASAPTTRAYSRIDDRTYQYVERVNGKITTTNRVTMAADGRTRTQVTTGTGADGRPVNNVTLWDRQ